MVLTQNDRLCIIYFIEDKPLLIDYINHKA